VVVTKKEQINRMLDTSVNDLMINSLLYKVCGFLMYALEELNSVSVHITGGEVLGHPGVK